MNNEEVIPEPKLNEVTLQPKDNSFPIMRHYAGASLTDFQGRIDGFKFKGTKDDATTAEVGGLDIQGGPGGAYTIIKNCVFIENYGQAVGALRVCNKSC